MAVKVAVRCDLREAPECKISPVFALLTLASRRIIYRLRLSHLSPRTVCVTIAKHFYSHLPTKRHILSLPFVPTYRTRTVPALDAIHNSETLFDIGFNAPRDRSFMFAFIFPVVFIGVAFAKINKARLSNVVLNFRAIN